MNRKNNFYLYIKQNQNNTFNSKLVRNWKGLTLWIWWWCGSDKVLFPVPNHNTTHWNWRKNHKPLRCRKWGTSKWFWRTMLLVFPKNQTWTLLKEPWNWRFQKVPLICSSKICTSHVIPTCDSSWPRTTTMLRELGPTRLTL